MHYMTHTANTILHRIALSHHKIMPIMELSNLYNIRLMKLHKLTKSPSLLKTSLQQINQNAISQNLQFKDNLLT